MTSLSDFPPDVQRAAAVVVFQFETDVQAGKFSNPEGTEASQALTLAVAGAIMADRAGRISFAGLTSQQAECLKLIVLHQRMHDGISPTYEQIKDALGLASKATVQRLLDALEERGRIARIPARARAITIIPNPAN